MNKPKVAQKIKLTRYEAKLLSTLVIIKLENLHNEKVEKLEKINSSIKGTLYYKGIKQRLKAIKKQIKSYVNLCIKLERFIRKEDKKGNRQ